MTQTTMAQQFADRLDNRGDQFTTVDGVPMHEALAELAHETRRDGRRGLARFEFADDSAIVVAEGGWDLGFAGTGCFCWQGVGHDDECQHG